jgi:hypothetical protein
MTARRRQAPVSVVIIHSTASTINAVTMRVSVRPPDRKPRRPIGRMTGCYMAVTVVVFDSLEHQAELVERGGMSDAVRPADCAAHPTPAC